MRLATICNFPSTDEGYYAFSSMLAHDALKTHGLYPLGPMHLYPLLLNFVFSWDINHIIALRFCDLVVSILVAWQWFRLLERESGSLLAGVFLAVFAVFTFNHPLFVQHGFKSSLSIGFVFADWTIEKLVGSHPSIPRNPSIANVFYLAGHIETWGRGIEKS